MDRQRVFWSTGRSDTRVVNRLLHAYLSRQFLVFLLFGGAAAAVNLVVGSLIYGSALRNIVPYWCAVTVGSLSGILVNFFLNRTYNFPSSGRPLIAQFRTFFGVAMGGTVLTAILSEAGLGILRALGIEAATLPGGATASAPFISHFLSVGLVAFYSYGAHRYLTFSVGLRSRLREAAASIRSK